MLVPVLLGATLLLSGCQPSGPSVIETPGIQSLEEGTSSLESDPWVQAARESDLGYRLAVNNQDFTIEQYTSTRTPAIAIGEFDGWVTQYIEAGAEPIAYPGPSILLPISVEPNAAGDEAELTFCNASGRFQLTAGETEPEYSLPNGRLVTWTMVTSDEGVRVVTIQSNSTEECDATGAPVEVFDPLPTVPEKLSLADARPPVGWSE